MPVLESMLLDFTDFMASGESKNKSIRFDRIKSDYNKRHGISQDQDKESMRGDLKSEGVPSKKKKQESKPKPEPAKEESVSKAEMKLDSSGLPEL